MTFRPKTILGISGSVGRPSRTTSLVSESLGAIADLTGADSHLIELVDEAPALFQALTPYQLKSRAHEVVHLVESADLLVVGTPVYRASMTGALKHLFDLVDHRCFVGKPVALVATGGSLLHGLVLEHQMRPLFGFLNALTLPTTIYAVEADFDGYQIGSAKVRERIGRVAREAAVQLERPLFEAREASLANIT